MNPLSDQLADAIHGFIRQTADVEADDTDLSHTVDLFDAGYVDSAGIVALTAFIEQTFDIFLDDEVLFDPRFATINGIVEIIGSLQD